MLWIERMLRNGRAPKRELQVSQEQQRELESLAEQARERKAVAFRAKILWECSKGVANSEVARKFRCSNPTVGMWRNRFIEGGVEALFDERATGNVIGKCFERHRKKFLDHVDSIVPSNLDVHLVLDNYATHKTPLIKRWLSRRPRYRLHFTPTHSSWIHQIERWFFVWTKSADQILQSIARFAGSHLAAQGKNL